jgi:hypothetical protein
MPPRRDPVSTLFDGAARALLARAYQQPGSWVRTRVQPPTAAHEAWAASQGIDVRGRDQWGRPRWEAGFIRAVYYQHKYAGVSSRPIRYEIGRPVPFRGRAVRIQSVQGGRAAARAVQGTPRRQRIYTDTGQPGGRWANPAARDW